MKPFSFKEALSYLERVVRAGIKYDLNNIRTLLQLLAYPQNNYPIICVAGTNGKGSTSAFLESILAEAGYTAGLNTSPHLVSPRERLRINREIASEADFAVTISAIAKACNSHWDESDPYRPTFFETMTSAALLYFQQKSVDVAIMEAGLGGRLDATNALNPMLTIITRIGLDHPRTLGNTLKKIAFEKFGLARNGKPLLIAKQRKHIVSHLQNLSTFRGSHLLQALGKWSAKAGIQKLETRESSYNFSRFGIPGSYQRENVTSAVVAAELLNKRGFSISSSNIENGIAKAFWPGRMEFKQGPPRILMDGSHNTDGIQNLVVKLKQIPANKLILIYGKVGERSARTTAAKLLPLASHVLLPPLQVGRANNPQDLVNEIDSYNQSIEVCASMEIAWQKAQDIYQNGDLIVVAGSLYLVGEFKKVTGDSLDND
jgi:dihydrofolate synthase/folylpolyglutamate synthase